MHEQTEATHDKVQLKYLSTVDGAVHVINDFHGSPTTPFTVNFRATNIMIGWTTDHSVNSYLGFSCTVSVA